MTPLDTAGLDIYNTHRTYHVDGHTIHIGLHSTRWRWDIHGPDGRHCAAGSETSPGEAGWWAMHALERLKVTV
jgi:hypothetical protein